MVCSSASMQSFSMMLNTDPGLTTVVCFTTQLEGFSSSQKESYGTFDWNLCRELAI